MKPEVKPGVAAARQLAAAEKKFQSAEIAAAVLESEAERAERRAAKLDRTDLEWLRYLSGMGEGWKDGLLPDEVHAARDAELSEWAAARKHAREARVAALKAQCAVDEAQEASEKAHTAAEEAREAVAADKLCAAGEQGLKKSVREISLEAEVERLQLEVQQLRAREAERAAQDAEIARLHEKRRVEFERESREMEREVCRSQWYWSRSEVMQQHAEKVWGPDWKCENSVPKVFSLIGKSADEVRALSAEVSQVATTGDERAKLNRVQWEMLEK